MNIDDELGGRIREQVEKEFALMLRGDAWRTRIQDVTRLTVDEMKLPRINEFNYLRSDVETLRSDRNYLMNSINNLQAQATTLRAELDALRQLITCKG